MKLIAPYTLYEDPTFKPLTDILVLADAAREWNGGVVTATITDDSLVTIPTVMAWIAGGGEVEEMPAFIEFTPAAYAKNVPEGIPNRSYTNDKGNESIRTWSEWKDATHEHREINGKHYVPSNAFGYDLKGSELTIVHAISGANVLTAAEYKALIPVEDE